jgi:glycosyltransferase involved in cell wall biosynthesis
MVPVKLSVVIIAFNEERNIGRCLESVKTVADEMVVIDSGSTDATQKICESYGARVVQRPFTNYVDQKNFANQQSSFPHILSLDADEALTPELAAEILAIKNNWQLAGYYLKRLTNYCGTWVKHGGWYPDKKLRLFDRNKGSWQGLLLHEEYKTLTGEQTGLLENDLLHYSFYSLDDHLNQLNKFTTIAVQEMKMKGKKKSLLPLFYKPPFKFFSNYILKSGWRDGFAGFCIAVVSAYGVFVKYAKLYLSE